MKTKLIALVLGLAAAGAANAAPSFSFTNVPAGWDGTFSVKLAGYESFSGDPLTAGSQNFGVLRVTGIYTLGGDPLWVQGQGGAEITGVFSGITVANSSATQLNSTGGSASFFINPVGSLTGQGGFAQGLAGYSFGTCSANQNCYNGISNVLGGGSFLDLNYVPGIAGAGITVAGALTASTPLTGTATGYLAVTGGTYQNTFDTNGYVGGTADMIAKNSFYTVGQPGGGTLADAGGASNPANAWQLRIDDPITGAARLPEPASMALVGAALLGLGLARRRKSV